MLIATKTWFKSYYPIKEKKTKRTVTKKKNEEFKMIKMRFAQIGHEEHPVIIEKLDGVESYTFGRCNNNGT